MRVIKLKFLQFCILSMGLLLTSITFANVGTIIFKTGEASVTHADNASVPAEKNLALLAGDTIETRDGRVQFSLIDGGKISLQPNSIFKINKYEFSGKEDGSEYAFMELVKGGLRTISGLIGHKNRERYQLKTTVATIGIRGTEYTVNFNNNQFLMTTNHGSVDVCNSGGCLNALTGQSIAVSGPGASPKFSSKAAKAAAAPAASSKAAFAAGEQINTAALTTAPVTTAPMPTPTPTPTTGNDTIVSLATMPIGVLDQNGVYKGTTTFTGNDLISFADNSGTPNIVTGTIEESNADTFVKWGRASGGTYDGQAMLMTSWVTGIATPSAAISALNGASIIGAYTITKSTAPYLVSTGGNGGNGGNVTTGLTDSVTGGLILNFSTYKLAYNLSIPIAGNTITINGSNVLLDASSAKLSDNTATITGAGITGSGILFNNASVEGSLFGSNAERVGLQYGVQVTGGGLPNRGGNLYGSVVGTKQ